MQTESTTAEINAPGTMLANGSVVIEQRRDVVLCALPHNSFTPYATWRIGVMGDTAHGDYFRTLPEAVEGFNKRAA